MTIVEFLLARIAEDEAAARAASDGALAGPYNAHWDKPFSATIDVGGEVIDTGDRQLADHIARHDPARVLAECAAKRRLVALHELDPDAGVDYECGEVEHNWPCPTLRALATPFSDDPDYRDAWS